MTHEEYHQALCLAELAADQVRTLWDEEDREYVAHEAFIAVMNALLGSNWDLEHP
jgi:hypothetical protein